MNNTQTQIYTLNHFSEEQLAEMIKLKYIVSGLTQSDKSAALKQNTTYSIPANTKPFPGGLFWIVPTLKELIFSFKNHDFWHQALSCA